MTNSRLGALIWAALLLAPGLARAQVDASRNVAVAAEIDRPDGTTNVLLEQHSDIVWTSDQGGRIAAFSTTDGSIVGQWDAETPVHDLARVDNPDGGHHLAISTGTTVHIRDVADPSRIADVVSLPVEGAGALFAYKHSGGQHLLLIGTMEGVQILDAGNDYSTLATITLPDDAGSSDSRAVYAAYELGTESDRVYVAGASGYYVVDITDPSDISHLTWVNSAAVQMGTGIQASPDGSHLVTFTNYDSAPVRIFDIRPALDGSIPQVRTAAGAWTANWKGRAESAELRWPYLFVASGSDGVHMINMRNAFEPYTMAAFQGAGNAVDLDVRNRDGMIAVADSENGLWLLKIDDFRGWDGRGWGQPNVSTVQDWVDGPIYSDRW